MYTSCDELLDRINNLEFTEDSLPIMTRITYALYDLKKYISEYIISIFPRKSYIENDIAFNRFLMILNSVKDIQFGTRGEADDSGEYGPHDGTALIITKTESGRET